jgi:sec-independent protein translocase protein TatC
MKTPFQEDDYFKGSTMSFGEHLEELRRVLINALTGLAVCMVIGFLLAPAVVRFFKVPIEQALEEFYVGKALSELDVRFNYNPPLEMVHLVKNREMVPEYQQMEISEFLENLQAMHPGQFEGLAFSPYTFVPDDFEAQRVTVLWQGVGVSKTPEPAAVAFAQRLAAEGQADDATAGTRLWERLSEFERGIVRDIAEKSEDDVTLQERRALASMLNRVIADAELYRTEEFRGIEPADDSEALVAQLRAQLEAQTSPSTSVVRRLNKLLLTNHFASQLRPSQLALVDVPIWKPVRIRVQSLNAQEAFMIWLKASFMTGLVISSPWIFYQIWVFVGAGLYPHEKKYVYIYLPISLLLFISGAALAFGFVFQPVLSFLFQFNQMMEIDPDPRIGEWLGFVLVLPLGFGVSFQLPLVMLFLERIGVVDIKTYLQQWRLSILIIALISMVLTPSDPYSMLLMMIPLVFLYFVGIALCRWMPRGRNPFDEMVHEP